MENVLSFINHYISGFASAAGIVIAVLYIWKPRFKIEPKFEPDEIKVDCINKNPFKRPIYNVRCEIVMCESDVFKSVNTLELRKDWTPKIRNQDKYVFKTKLIKDNHKIKSEISKGQLKLKDVLIDKYIRVQIMSNNSIGVLKVTRDNYKYKISQDNAGNIKFAKI